MQSFIIKDSTHVVIKRGLKSLSVELWERDKPIKGYWLENKRLHVPLAGGFHATIAAENVVVQN